MNKYKIIKNAQPGEVIHVSYHLAAMEELTNEVRLLTDRLAIVEKERDSLLIRQEQMSRQLAISTCDAEDAIKERDELRRGKSCSGCRWEHIGEADACWDCIRVCVDKFKPRDPSAEQGGVK